MACSWISWKNSAPFGWSATFSWPLMSLRTRPKTSAWRWLLVCFSSVKNHNVSGPHLFPSFTTHAKKNHFAIGRNSKRCSYRTDLSRFVLPISDPSELNFSQYGGFQNFPNLSKIEKVAETCEFFRKRAAVRRKNHSNLNKSFGMKTKTATNVCRNTHVHQLMVGLGEPTEPKLKFHIHFGFATKDKGQTPPKRSDQPRRAAGGVNWWRIFLFLRSVCASYSGSMYRFWAYKIM